MNDKLAWRYKALSTIALAACGAAAHADITTPPQLPAYFSMAICSGDEPGFAFMNAEGTARLEDGWWTADIVSNGAGSFQLDAQAAMRVVFQSEAAPPATVTWKNFQISFEPSQSWEMPRVYADRYVNGQLQFEHEAFAFLGDPDHHGVDGLPEGVAHLWLGGGSGARLAYDDIGEGALWAPYAFAGARVTAVPEPSAWALSLLGLAMLGGRCRPFAQT